MIITALNYDDLYLKQLLGFLSSLRINSPNDKCLISLINFPHETIRMLSDTFPEYLFIDSFVNFGEHNVRDFMSCYSTQIMRRAIEDIKEPIAWFDADTLVRKNLNEFWENTKENTLQIMVRDTEDIEAIFQVGVFSVGISESTKKLIRHWDDSVKNEIRWFSEQKNLYLSYQNFKHEIELIAMDKKFNDVGGKKDSFSKNSVVWHSKGIHFYEDKFQEEFLLYFGEI